MRVFAAAALNEYSESGKPLLPAFGEPPAALVAVYDEQHFVYLTCPLAKLMRQYVPRVR
jgi:hypothetical protein